MKWFKRKKESVVNDQLANKIAGFIGKVQHSFVSFMIKATDKLSLRSLKITLFLFIILGTGTSIYIAIAAVSKKQNAININHIRATNYLVQNDQQSQIISKSQYEQLLRFDQHMDSLKKSQPKLYDSILKLRPGLPDSIKLIESFYNHQNK